MSQSPATVLIVSSDTTDISDLVSVVQKSGYQTQIAYTHVSAIELVNARDETDDETPAAKPFNLVLIADELNDSVGYELCRLLRKSDSLLPLVMFSPSTEEVDRYLAAEVGADAYIQTPATAEEIQEAMVNAIYKAASIEITPRVLTFGELEIDLNTRKVHKKGAIEKLTDTEFEVLAVLAANPGKYLSREEILMQVRGFLLTIDTRTIDVHVHHIRGKVEPTASTNQLIRTVKGVGYRLANVKSVKGPVPDPDPVDIFDDTDEEDLGEVA